MSINYEDEGIVVKPLESPRGTIFNLVPENSLEDIIGKLEEIRDCNDLIISNQMLLNLIEEMKEALAKE